MRISLDMQSKKSSVQDTEAKPKRPFTPYFRFANKKRASVKEANPSWLFLTP